MSVLDRIGHEYDPVVYSVQREDVIAFAEAIGARDPLHLDYGAASDAGFEDVVAPAMFAVVYAGEAVRSGLFDPELGIDFAHLVHGAQEFLWPGPAVVAGEDITTVARVADVRETAGLHFYVFSTESTNRDGATVASGLWTNIVRPVDG
jgi:acyl dehydratase